MARADWPLRFSVLGSLEAWSAGSRLRLGGMIRERVLAVLLLEYGKMLPVSRLIAAVWAENPPDTASHQVRKAVSDLRRVIPDGDKLIVTDGYGYRAAVTDAQLDLAEFKSLLHQAGSAAEAGDRDEVMNALRSALALWRGPVLSGEGGAVIEAAAVALTERRLAAFEQLTELRLETGESSGLVAELREYIDQHPLRETLHGQLMIALYRSGRQAEALEEYGRVRELLAEELGTDPGPGLAQVYEAVLRQSPELLPGEPADPAAPLAVSPGNGTPRGPVVPTIESPRTLPHDLSDFTGRHQEIDEILSYVRTPGEHGTRIVAIDGMGGCGKTSLAVHAAHLLSADYPDAQIYLDLHGYTSDEQPVTVSAALHDVLRILGVPGDRIPDDVAGRVAVWRSALTGKRVLLLADNAADAAPVRALMPASPGCLVLLTSRARLVELDGAAWISIGPMSPADSTALMRATLGEERVMSEPEAAAELVRLCGHLPLALRIAAARLRNRPAWTLRYLVGRLRDETRGLDELSSGGRSIAGTFGLSYASLDDRCRAGLAVLALYPGEAIDVYSAAALLGTSVTAAEDVLEMLLDAHLLQQPAIGLYTFHDLIRGFARRLRGDSAPEAIERLLDYYVTVTGKACDVLFADRSRRSTGITPYPLGVPEIRDARQAQEWFTREHKGLLSVVTLAQSSEHDRHAIFLARDIGFYLDASGYMEEFWQLCGVAVDSGRHLGSPDLLALALVNLSIACWKLGKHAEGAATARQARDIAVRIGDQRIEAFCERNLGRYKTVLGDFPEAAVHVKRSIELEDKLGDVRPPTLTALSALHAEWGRYRDALHAAYRASKVARQLGQPRNEWVALTDLASAHVGLGEYAEAGRCLTRARELCDETTEEPGLVAVMLALSAEVSCRLHQDAQAADYADRTLSLISLTSSPARRVKALNTIGRLLMLKGEYTSALDVHTRARELAGKIGYGPEEARALSGMSQAMAALGDERAAASCESAARDLFAAMGIEQDQR